MKGLKKGIVFVTAVLLCAAAWALGTEKEHYRLTTHVTDAGTGNPVSDVRVVLYRMDSARQWVAVDSAQTDLNGRVDGFPDNDLADSGVYKLLYRTEPYFTARGLEPIYPYIEVVLRVREGRRYHIPLSVATSGYSIFP